MERSEVNVVGGIREREVLTGLYTVLWRLQMYRVKLYEH
jgi:hypothetical protein